MQSLISHSKDLMLILQQWVVTEVLKQESDIVRFSISKRSRYCIVWTVYLRWSRVYPGRPIRRLT